MLKKLKIKLIIKKNLNKEELKILKNIKKQLKEKNINFEKCIKIVSKMNVSKEVIKYYDQIEYNLEKKAIEKGNEIYKAYLIEKKNELIIENFILSISKQEQKVLQKIASFISSSKYF